MPVDIVSTDLACYAGWIFSAILLIGYVAIAYFATKYYCKKKHRSKYFDEYSNQSDCAIVCYKCSSRSRVLLRGI